MLRRSSFVGLTTLAILCLLTVGGVTSCGSDADDATPSGPSVEGGKGQKDARSSGDDDDDDDARDGGDEGPGEEPTDPVQVTGDPTKGVLLQGTVIGPSGPYEGEVLTTPQGLIACAMPGTACSADPRAAGVAKVDVKGIISPGLIDTHNHILFDIFDPSDWTPQRTYQHHDDWTKDSNEPRYTVMVDVKQCLENASQGKPSWCPTKYAGTNNIKCEMEKWGELKGVVAGTTSIVGLPGTASPCFASLARTIDTPYHGLDADRVQTAAITPSKATADGVCANYASGKTNAYLIHAGEGLNASALNEFPKLGSITTIPECLYAPQTAITHGTAFSAAEFAKMKSKDMKLTWSPHSNIVLYGETTNIPAALDAGLLVSLAPDWSMSGSQNLLDEMRYAKSYSDTKWRGRLSAKDIVTMATINGAIVVGRGGELGSLEAGKLADIFVVRATSKQREAPYDTLVNATPKEVLLTMVAGKVIYGGTDVRALAAYGSSCENFNACGNAKFVCVAVPGGQNKLDQTYAQLRDILDTAMKDMDQARPANIGGNFTPVAPIVTCPNP